MKIKEILKPINNFAPTSFQESYDNVGLLVGNADNEALAALITIDVTEEVIEEAIQKKANLIIAHHPLIFGGLKRLTGRNYMERCVIKAIQNDIAIYAAHTNLDSILGGVNSKIAEKLGLKNCTFLIQRENELRKLVTFVPQNHAEKVRNAIFEAGAGHIGNYDSCSFNVNGEGSFRAKENANPFVGNIGELHFESEVKIETIYPKFLEKNILTALLAAHPYEEVAYDIYPLANSYANAGTGMIGELPKSVDAQTFLAHLKTVFGGTIRHTSIKGKQIKKVAFCGGSGSTLLPKAMAMKADIFISSDFKYHQFFDTENQILIADVGHYESEQFTKDIFVEILSKNFPNFACYLSEITTNPIKYL